METISAAAPKASRLTQKQPLFQEANRLRATEQVLHEALNDSELASHCHVAAWHNGGLKVLVDSATWATRLRFQIPQLLDALKPQLPALKIIECRVFPQPGAKEVTYWQAESISREAAEMLRGTAEGVSDAKLKAALLRLAETKN